MLRMQGAEVSVVYRPPCGLCVSEYSSGVVEFRREQRGVDQPWVHVETRAEVPVCLDCTQWLHKVLGAAADRSGADRPSGFPAAAPGAPGGQFNCDFCGVHLLDEAHVLDLIPERGRFVRRFSYLHAGAVRQHRLCVACWTWARSLMFDPAAVRGTSTRRDEGPPGTWLGATALDACSANLLAADAAVIGEVTQAGERRHIPLSMERARHFGGASSEVLFVGCSAAGRASALLQGLAERARERTVVVARIDALEDMANALGLGAAEFITSPVTPQQVAAAFDRVAAGHDADREPGGGGLPVYARVPAATPQPGQVIDVTVPASEDIRETAWLLRRFLRGYDRVGAAPSGGLEVTVYCPDNAVQRVLERLRVLLGRGVKLQLADRIEPAVAGARAA